MTERIRLGDSDIRPALWERLRREHSRHADTILINELGLCRGRVRVDMAAVNGQLHGYEIKSDLDSLRRLATQVRLYSMVLDRVTLVVGDRYLTDAFSILPAWWGVVNVRRANTRIRFKTVRRALNNPDRDPAALVELLWLDETVALLEERNAARGVRGKPRRVAWERACEILTLEEIAAAVRSRLKARARRPGTA